MNQYRGTENVPDAHRAIRISGCSVSPELLFGAGNYSTYECRGRIYAAGLSGWGEWYTIIGISEAMRPRWTAYKRWIKSRVDAGNRSKPSAQEVAEFLSLCE